MDAIFEHDNFRVYNDFVEIPTWDYFPEGVEEWGSGFLHDAIARRTSYSWKKLYYHHIVSETGPDYSGRIIKKEVNTSYRLRAHQMSWQLNITSKNPEKAKEELDNIAMYISTKTDHEKARKYLSNYPIEKDKLHNIGIELSNKLMNNEVIANSNVDDYIVFWQSICDRIDKSEDIPKHAKIFLDLIEEKSLIMCANLAEKCGMKNFGVTTITNSTNNYLPPGDYFYDFDDSNSLRLLKIPLFKFFLPTIKEDKTRKKNVKIYSKMIICDNSVEISKEDIFIISKDMIHDFDIDGTQVSEVETIQDKEVPIANTMIAEFLFGSSYATIKGLSNSMPKIQSKIVDLRVIQLIFQDKSDIRFRGVAIYYDLKRYLGKIKTTERKEFDVKDNLILDTNIENKQFSVDFENLKLLKELLDSNIITQEEFDMKKKIILNL